MEEWRQADEVYLVACKTLIRAKGYEPDSRFEIPKPGEIAIMPEVVGEILEWLNPDAPAGKPASTLDRIGRDHYVWDDVTGGVTIAFLKDIQQYEAKPAALWARETAYGIELRLDYADFQDFKSYRGDYLISWIVVYPS